MWHSGMGPPPGVCRWRKMGLVDFLASLFLLFSLCHPPWPRTQRTQSALAKERRELKEQQQRTLLDAIPKDLSRPWEDPMADPGVCMCVCVCARAWLHVHVCVCARVCVHACVPLCTPVCACMCASLHPCRAHHTPMVACALLRRRACAGVRAEGHRPRGVRGP